MKYIILVLALTQVTLSVDLNAQSDKDDSYRLTMVIPDNYANAGSDESTANYKSKRGRTSLSLFKAFKDEQKGFKSAQEAADQAYKELQQEGLATEMSVVTEKIGNSSFTILSWVIPRLKNDFEPHMIAFNDECEILYRFTMSSTTSNKKELDKVFRSFLRSCKKSKTN